MDKKLLDKASRVGKIIPFDQSGEFFHRRGCKELDDNNFIEALSYYRRAVAKEPENIEFRLAMAEVFTEMSRFEESNRILLLLTGGNEVYTECFFGMGCNFIGLQEYERALDSFKRYIELDPDGEYADEVYDILDMLEEQELFDEAFGRQPSEHERKVAHMVSECKTMLDNGDVERAVKCLEKVYRKNEHLHFVRTNLSLAYYCLHNYEKAIALCEGVLDEDENELNALCNLAIFYNETGAPRFDDMLNKIRKVQTEAPEELMCLALTFMRLDMYEEAYKRLKLLLRALPFEIKALHVMAACCYNMEQFDRAEKYWLRIRKIDPLCSVADYYLGEARSAQRGEKHTKQVLLHLQVPMDEVIRRINHLNELIQMDHESLRKRWESDEKFLSFLLWGLQMQEIGVKRAILAVIVSFGDDKAREALRNFLLLRDQPDETKREVFAMLKAMGAKEPYMAYMGQQIVEVRVSVLGSFDEELPEPYRRVIEICMQSMRDRHSANCMQKAMDMWEKYVRHQKKPLPVIRSAQVWAAALEYTVCRAENEHVTKTQICYAYDISIARLNSTLAKLVSGLRQADHADSR